MPQRPRGAGFRPVTLPAVVLAGCFVLGALAARPGYATDPALEAHEKLLRAFDAIISRHPEPVDDDAMVARAIQSMVSGLDPYAVLLDRNAYRLLQEEVRGTYVGLGVEVELAQDALTIVSSLEETPAYGAGLRAGDRITTLDGVSLAGLTLEQALHLARGEAGSPIRLTVVSPGDKQPRSMTLTRALIPQLTLHAQRLPDDIGYLRVERFHRTTPDLVRRSLERLYHQSTGKVGGLVIDLRDNPGGSVRAAVEICSAFLPERTLVVTLDGPSIPEDDRTYITPADIRPSQENNENPLGPFIESVPIVVLIDGTSASAAEIVAGCLQDHKRARLVGTRSFGKGTVQSVVPLGDGSALRLTVGRYRTPSGRLIQGNGIEPDARVDADAPVTLNTEPGEQAIRDRQLLEALRLLAHPKAPAPERTAASGSNSPAAEAPGDLSVAGR